jgi:hypothetical protein
MSSSSQSTKNIRRDLERSWPKDILASRVSMTPLLALESNAKRVLDETKRIGKEEEEEVYEDISADAKEIETLLDEMRKERDVCVCFHHDNRYRSMSRDDEDEEKKKKKEEKFLRSCFPRQGVKVVEDEREASLDARVRIFDRFSYEREEEEEERWMTDAIECIERSRKSNVFIVVENCETEEKARELRSEVYSGAMAFSKKRSEEDEFCFCLEGGLVFEDDGEERVATTTTTTSFETENKNRSRGLFALGSDDSSDSSEDDIDEDKIAKEIGILSVSDNNTDRKTCQRAQTNISNAIREICFERAEKYALRYQPIRERIYAKLKEKAKAKKKREKEKNAQHQTFSVSNDEPVRMSANASSPLVKNKQIVEETNKKEGGVLSFLDWMGSEEDGNVSPSEQKGISYQSKADAARIKALEAALRELQPDHPLLMFCPVLPPKT